MPEVEMVLVTGEGQGGWSNRKLWRKTLRTPFLPEKGDDLVHILWSEEDEEYFPLHVRNRWWGAKGEITLEFPYVWVSLPEDPWDGSISPSLIASNYATCWNVDLDGDLYEPLKRSGWVTE